MATAADALAPLPNRIEPRWWTGAAPIAAELFTIDRAGRPITEADLDPGSALACEMNRMFDETGLVLVTNTGLTDLPTMRRIAQHVITAEMNYTGGANLVTGVDINPYLPREAAALLEADGKTGIVTLKEGSGEALPLPDGSFDAAMSITVIEEVDADQMLAEMMRVTRPGGRVALIARAIDMPLLMHVDLPPELKAKVEAPGAIGTVAPKGCADSSL